MNWLARNWGKVVTIIILAVIGFRLIDLVMLWGLYNSFSSTFRNLGIADDHLVGAMSIATMTVAALLLGRILRKFILRRTDRGTLFFGVILTGWMLLLFFLSLPKEGEYFNTVTGQPRYVFGILPDGEIDLKPLGHEVHPNTGQKMELFTREMRRKYATELKRFEERKAAEKRPAPVAKTMRKKVPTTFQWQWPVANKRSPKYPDFRADPPILELAQRISQEESHCENRSSIAEPGGGLFVKVLSVGVKQDRFEVYLEVKNSDPQFKRELRSISPTDTYLVAEDGQALRLVEDRGKYWKFTDDCRGRPYRSWWDGDFYYRNITFSYRCRVLLPGEVYRFWLYFTPLTHGPKKLIFDLELCDKIKLILL